MSFDFTYFLLETFFLDAAREGKAETWSARILNVINVNKVDNLTNRFQRGWDKVLNTLRHAIRFR